jgi:hypothetical protein
MLAEFLGRDASPAAFLEMRGMTGPSTDSSAIASAQPPSQG